MALRLRHLLSAGLLLCVLAGGAWWLLEPARTAALTDAAPVEEGPAASADPAALAARALARANEGEVGRLPRGRVTGIVLRRGEPVAAQVSAYEVARAGPGGRIRPRPLSSIPPEAGAAPAAVGVVSAGADGAFALDLPAPARYLLVARGAGIGREAVTLAADGARVHVRFELRGGEESLAGRARHADGRPFRGRISVEPAGVDDAIGGVESVATADDGTFAVAGLESGPHVVSAFLPGRWRVWGRPVTIPHAGEYDFVVDEGLREVTGRVVDAKDGRGIPGAVVTVQGWRLGEVASFQSRAVAEGDGRFSLLVPGWQSSWRVEAAGFAPLGTWRRHAPEGSGLELRMERLAGLSGRVTTDVGGAPAAGVTVFVSARDGDQGAEGVTDADGRYVVEDAPPGEVTVFAWGRGWCTKDLPSVSQGGFNPLGVTLLPGAAAVVDLVVTKAARATGKVVDASDAPVVGARVQATPTPPQGARRWAFPWIAEAFAVATDAEGRFGMDTLLPGLAYTFEAVAPDASPATSPSLRADAATPLVVDLRLGAARWAQVTVVLKGAKTPVSGVSVQGYHQTPDGEWRSFGPATTGAGGLARLGPAPAGPFQLWAWGSGHQMQEGAVVGGPEGSLAPVEATVEVSRTRTVAGTVRFASGDPAHGLVVRVKGTGFESTEGLGEDGGFEVQIDGEDDTVEVAVLKDWEGQDVVYETRAKPGDRALSLTVPGAPSPRLSVRVLDPAGKRVPAGMAVLQIAENAAWEGVVDGLATFDAPTQAAHLLVHSLRTEGGTKLPLGLAIAGPVDAKATEFEVRVGPEVPIEGVVRTADGQPVRGVFLRAKPKGLAVPFQDWGEDVATARTDDAGRFRLGGLSDGRYELRVDAADRAGRTEPLEVAAGRTDVEIVLGVGLEVLVKVVGPDGLPVASATVGVQGGKTRQTAVDCDALGVGRLKGLDPGSTYTLWAAPPPGRRDLLRSAIERWSPRDETVSLPRGFAVQGVVRDRQGRAVAGAQVDRVAEGNVVQSVRTGADGAFTLAGLPAGAVLLAARATEGGARSRAVSVAAGAEDVVLVLDATGALRLKIQDWAGPADGFWATLHDEATGTTTDWGQVDPSGAATIPNVLPDAMYTLYLVVEDEASPEGRVAWRAGIRGDAGETTATLVPGLVIGVRLILPPGVDSAEVVASDGVVRRGANMEDATRGRVTGLHPGTWTVRAVAKTDLGEYAAQAQVDAGGSATLDLKPVR